MKKHILLLLFGLLVIGVAHASEDPMKSLFVFQQKMANNGSTTAMMKLGEMYEQGLGTKQDFDKAIQMYRKAKAGGNAGADAEIERVMRTRQASAGAAQQEKARAAEEKRRQQAYKRDEAERRAEAEHQAQQAQLQRQAREKARQEALARKRAEQARLDAEARAKADQAARARAADEARRHAQQQAHLNAHTVIKQQPAVTEKKVDGNKPASFKSDPCKGPAARVMSICK